MADAEMIDKEIIISWYLNWMWGRGHQQFFFKLEADC
jgi:hypothetical protein